MKMPKIAKYILHSYKYHRTSHIKLKLYRGLLQIWTRLQTFFFDCAVFVQEVFVVFFFHFAEDQRIFMVLMIWKTAEHAFVWI